MISSLFSRRKPNYSKKTIDILRIIRSENVGPKTFFRLMKVFGSAEKALANMADFSIKGGKKKAIKVFSEDEVYDEIEKLEYYGASLISIEDELYPKLLKKTIDHPPILTYKGNINLLQSDDIVAIVGARNASINGRCFAKKLALELKEIGFNTISGLARGIDSAVHAASTDNTIAVIAGGINNIYPYENKKLYEEIASNGLILSEHPFDSKPLSSHFPMRNRIISGAARATAIIEAGLSSGSLITANFALDQNRDIFAMPGFPLDPRSKGTNKLIKDGAYLLESAEDIINNISSLDKINFEEKAVNDNAFNANTHISSLQITDKNREKILELLSSSYITIENIAKETGFDLSMIYVVCLELELAGRVLRGPGGKIALNYE